MASQHSGSLRSTFSTSARAHAEIRVGEEHILLDLALPLGFLVRDEQRDVVLRRRWCDLLFAHGSGDSSCNTLGAVIPEKSLSFEYVHQRGRRLARLDLEPERKKGRPVDSENVAPLLARLARSRPGHVCAIVDGHGCDSAPRGEVRECLW